MQLAFYVRTKGDPSVALPILREKVAEIDPNVSVFDAVPLTEYVGASLYPQKVAASLLSVLGSLAVLLAAVGLYSVMAYSIVQRTHEIGIRMALGARPADVLRLMVVAGAEAHRCRSGHRTRTGACRRAKRLGNFVRKFRDGPWRKAPRCERERSVHLRGSSLVPHRCGPARGIYSRQAGSSNRPDGGPALRVIHARSGYSTCTASSAGK